MDNKDKKGFSLIEVIVALFILSIVLWPVTNYILNAKRYNMQNINLIRALNLGRAYLDNLYNEVRYDQWVPESNDYKYSGSNLSIRNHSTSTSLSYSYNITYNLFSDVTNLTNHNEMRKVKLTINWTD